MQRGVTLPELVVILALVAVLLGLTLPRLAEWTDRLAVNRSVSEIVAFYDAARLAAVFQNTRVRMEFRPDSLRAVLERDIDSTLWVRPGPSRHGALLEASRATIRIGPTGFGSGAANTKLVVRRGSHADSVTTSRMGRLKRW